MTIPSKSRKKAFVEAAPGVGETPAVYVLGACLLTCSPFLTSAIHGLFISEPSPSLSQDTTLQNNVNVRLPPCIRGNERGVVEHYTIQDVPRKQKRKGHPSSRGPMRRDPYEGLVTSIPSGAWKYISGIFGAATIDSASGCLQAEGYLEVYKLVCFRSIHYRSIRICLVHVVLSILQPYQILPNDSWKVKRRQTRHRTHCRSILSGGFDATLHLSLTSKRTQLRRCSQSVLSTNQDGRSPPRFLYDVQEGSDRTRR